MQTLLSSAAYDRATLHGGPLRGPVSVCRVRISDLLTFPAAASRCLGGSAPLRRAVRDLPTSDHSRLMAALLVAAGCGGGDEDTPSETAAKATPTATVESASREVTASVDGRQLSGHCSGTQQEGSPAILLDSGMGGGQHQLADIEQRFAERTLVCAYDRAGVGQATRRPRPRAR